jgi:hypothetical protein
MGYLNIDRRLFNHFLWRERRSFSRFEAWLDLVQLVSFNEKNDTMINGVKVEWGRGQYPVSYSFLSDRWVWSTNRVRGYMRLLKNNKQIDTKSTSVTTILTLCNYEQYNNTSQAEGQAKGQAEGISRGQAEGKRKAGIKLRELREVKETIVFNEFYDAEIIKSKQDQNYIKVVKILFGENNLGVPLKSVLKMEIQLSYCQFVKLWFLKEKYKISITELLEQMENWKELKNRKTIYSTFLTFAKKRNPLIETK